MRLSDLQPIHASLYDPSTHRTCASHKLPIVSAAWKSIMINDNNESVSHSLGVVLLCTEQNEVGSELLHLSLRKVKTMFYFNSRQELGIGKIIIFKL